MRYYYTSTGTGTSASRAGRWIEDQPLDDYDDLKGRQRRHLELIRGRIDLRINCLHDGCPECVGTGVKGDGSACIHHLSCPCPKCAPRC